MPWSTSGRCRPPSAGSYPRPVRLFSSWVGVTINVLSVSTQVLDDFIDLNVAAVARYTSSSFFWRSAPSTFWRRIDSSGCPEHAPRRQPYPAGYDTAASGAGGARLPKRFHLVHGLVVGCDQVCALAEIFRREVSVPTTSAKARQSQRKELQGVLLRRYQSRGRRYHRPQRLQLKLHHHWV